MAIKASTGRNKRESVRRGNTAPVLRHRERILHAALKLLAQGGRDALTTRAVAEAAGVQPPVLYRLFQDKHGLLNAVSEYGFALYFSEKPKAESGDDPTQFLRGGWARHVQFGLSHPELYLLMYADPHPQAAGRQGRHSHQGLRAHMRTIAAAGGLRVSEHHAADMFHAAACGVVLTLLADPADARDMALSEIACDAILASILTTKKAVANRDMPTTAIALRAQLSNPSSEDPLTRTEKALLLEWLERLQV